jgi:hypothetical protein
MGLLDAPSLRLSDPRAVAAPRLVTSPKIKNMVGAGELGEGTIKVSDSGASSLTGTSLTFGPSTLPIVTGVRTVQAVNNKLAAVMRARIGKGTLTKGSLTITGVALNPGSELNPSTSDYVTAAGLTNAMAVSSYNAGTKTLVLSGATGEVTGEGEVELLFHYICCFQPLQVFVDGNTNAFQFVVANTVAKGVSVRIWVNEQPVTWTPHVLEETGNRVVKVTGLGSEYKRIMIELIGNGATGFPNIASLYAENQTDTWYAPQVKTSRAVVIGDSICSGIGTAETGTDCRNPWSVQMMRRLGISDLVNLGWPSTGFSPPGPQYQACSAEVIALNPAVVVIQGTLNDTLYHESNAGVYDPIIKAHCAELLKALRAGLPSATIVMTKVLRPGFKSADEAVGKLYEEAAAEAGVTIVNPEGIISGSGCAATIGFAVTPNTSTATLHGTTEVTEVAKPGFVGGNGCEISGTNIKAGTTVTAGAGTATITISNAAEGSGAVTLTARAFPKNDGGADVERCCDFTHPNQRGHVTLGAGMVQRVASSLSVLP